jgi:HlyD family secretion protein
MRLVRQTPLIGLMFVAACSRAPAPDAYGNFETTEVVVGAETNGQLLWFTPTEGSKLAAEVLVGVVDTSQLALEREQIAAQRAGSGSRAAEVTQQIGALEVQQEIAQRTYERTKRLFAQQAATSQQLDQSERDYRVLGQQIQGARAQRQGAGHDIASAEARVAQIRDRIRKSQIKNPIGGTVLASYAKAGEFIQPGQALYKIANLDSMVLRAYVTESQLGSVRIGQPAQVSIDTGKDERRALTGTVIWVSSQAEFTPTPIQTREERADLVYAVKISVPNAGGVIKIGMPADVQFTTRTPVR